MRILFLTQIIPYPPDAGPKVKTWHVLRYLAERGHQVYLASFVRPDELGHIAPLRQVCADVLTVPIRRSRAADIGYYLRSWMRGRPFLIERDDLVQMRRSLKELMSRIDFDVIHADQLSMAQFALPSPSLFSNRSHPPQRSNSPGAGISTLKRPKLIFDAHNAVWEIVERMVQNVPLVLRPLLRVEARRLKLYEGMLVARFDHTLAVTSIDRQLLIAAYHAYAGPASPPEAKVLHAVHPAPEPEWAARLRVIPIAVDASALQPVVHSDGECTNILTLGTLYYPPNADGIRWFVRQVFPLVTAQVPEATLTILGKNPPQDFLDLARRDPDRVVVTGYVPDLAPYLEKAAVLVVPLRAGGGMRVRILEAFARAMPVVTTTVGLEGIEARPGEDVLVADDPAEFADAVVRVLKDEALRRRLAANGRRLAQDRYDWRVVLQKLDEVYVDV